MWFALQPRSLRVRRENTQNVPKGAPSTKIGAPVTNKDKRAHGAQPSPPPPPHRPRRKDLKTNAGLNDNKGVSQCTPSRKN